MIHLYCGDGKGKTTAATGLAVRAAGSGLKVVFSQFMKGGQSGEITILKNVPGITVMRARDIKKFTYAMSPEERAEAKKDNREHLEKTFETFNEQDADLLILDEAVTAVGTDMIDGARLKTLMESFSSEKELVITGSIPEEWMVEIADYVTDMEKIKHPFDKGIAARKGIEF